MKCHTPLERFGIISYFSPRISYIFFGHHLLEPLWSIGVEEIFYLIWAPIFKFGKQKILPILLSIILLKIILITLALFFIKDGLFNYFVNTFSFEAMAIGGLGAYFIFNREKPLSDLFLYNKSLQLFIYSILAMYLLFNVNFNNIIWNSIFKTPIISSILLDFLFLYLIVGVSLIDNSVIKFRGKVLSYLGEISYGIYMYHVLIIFTIVLFFKKYLQILNPISSSIAFYTLVTLTMILVSSVSKFYFENYFLKIKTGKIKEDVADQR